MVNHVPRLLVQKYGGADKINYAEVQRTLGLSYNAVKYWAEGRIKRFDDESLLLWCNFFNVKSTNEIIEYVPPKQSLN